MSIFCNKLQVAHKEVLAAKRALDTVKQQTLDEASKDILAIVVGDDKGCSAEDDDDDEALRTPDSLPSIATDSNKIKSTSEMTKNSLSNLSSGLSDSDINIISFYITSSSRILW